MLIVLYRTDECGIRWNACSGRVRSRTDSGLRQEAAPPRTGFTVNVCLAKSSRVLLHVLMQRDGWVEEPRAPGRGSVFWLVAAEDLEVTKNLRPARTVVGLEGPSNRF
jgi:hypothetical protein